MFLAKEYYPQFFLSLITSTIKQMKTSFIFFLLLFATYTSFTQNEFPSFGKVDLKELMMKECSFEKEANAQKLIDYQETEITTSGYDIRIKIERRVRIKIFNKSGVDAANIIIPYMRKSKKSKVNDISAYIYNLDSSGNNIITRKLEKGQIFKEKNDDGISTVAFTFPDVKPGSVIEYRYTHIEKNSVHLDPWFFQDRLPTTVSVCKFIYPYGMRFDYRFITSDSVTKEFVTRGSQYIRTFTQKNIYAFRLEPMMSSIKDNLQRVEFAFLPNFINSPLIIGGGNRWGIFNRALLMAPFFGEQMYIKIPGTESIVDSAKKISASGDKVHFIYQQVKQNLKWDDNLSFYADDLREVWQSKTANSAEINLCILNLLIKSGIKSYPILISTRANGMADPDFISLGQFNSVDVLVLDSLQYYILDGTQKYISYKVPPYNILNRNVFLIDTLNFKWVNITDSRVLMKTSITVKAELNKKGELKGDAYIAYYDHSKANQLEEQNEKVKEKEDEDKEFIEKESAEIIIDSLIQENADNELEPLIHRFNFTYKLSTANEYHFLDPFFLSNFRRNPFNDSLRRTDIDMGSNQSYIMYLYLTIPDDYQIDDLPKNILIRSNDSSMLFKREILRQNNVLVFRNSFDILRTVYAKEEYPGIKEYFKKIYGVVNDNIVLKKKN